MSPELPGGGDDSPQVEASASTPLRSAVDIAMSQHSTQNNQNVEEFNQQEVSSVNPQVNTGLRSSLDIATSGEGQVEQRLNQQVQEDPTTYQAQTIESPVPSPVQETVQQQIPVEEEAQVQDTSQVDVLQETVESPVEDVEGLTPREAEVVREAGNLSEEWGQRVKDEIIEMADRVGVFRVLRGAGKMIEGMRAKKIYARAFKHLENKTNEYYLSDQDNLYAKYNEATDSMFHSTSEDLKSNTSLIFARRFFFPYDKMVGREENREEQINILDRTLRDASSLREMGGFESFLLNLNFSIEHTLLRHSKDMARINQAKSDVGELRAEVTA